ncbi:MAG: WYL domain-containing protein [Myxococcota bacterium]
MSVSDRLGRLLFIVPYVASKEGVPLKELAEKVGATPAQVESDIDLLSMVGQPPLTPDHLIDLYVEDEVVYVELDQSLTRPLRLTHEEARALVLGAKLVGRQGGVGQELDSVLATITRNLNPADREAVESLSERVAMDDESGMEQHGAFLRRAVEESRVVQLEYYSLSSDALKRYRLEPLALITHGGFDYLVALDTAQDRHEKLFRLDRIGSVQMTEATFERSSDIDLERFRTDRLYFGDGAYTARVRFSESVADRAAERYPPEDVTRNEDGSADVRVRTSSIAWLARWVLSFGAEAEVLSPPEVRRYIKELCDRGLSVYES